MDWQTGVNHSIPLAVEEGELQVGFGDYLAVDEAAAGCLADVAADLGGFRLSFGSGQFRVRSVSGQVSFGSGQFRVRSVSGQVLHLNIFQIFVAMQHLTRNR